MFSDDYLYANGWGSGIRIDSLSAAWQSTYMHYFQWNARLLSVLILNILLLCGKFWFNIAVALVYGYLVVLIYWYVAEKVTLQLDPKIIALATAFCFLSYLSFSEVFLWMSGATVYPFSEVIALTFALPYYLQYRGKKPLSNKLLASVTMLVSGFLVTFQVENTVATLLVAVVAACFVGYRKKALTAWMTAGVIGMFIGCAIIFVSPTTLGRSEVADHNYLLSIVSLINACLQEIYYGLTVVLALLLAWKVLAKNTLASQGASVAIVPEQRFGATDYVLMVIVAAMLISYLFGAVVSKSIVIQVVTLLGAKVNISPKDLAITLADSYMFEEGIVYVLTSILGYRIMKRALGVSSCANSQSKVAIRVVLAFSAEARQAALFLTIAMLSNIWLVAQGWFSLRTCFGATTMLIIAALKVLNAPSVMNQLFSLRNRLMTILLLVLMVVPLASLVAYGYWSISQDEKAIIGAIEAAKAQNENTIIIHRTALERDHRLQAFGHVDWCRFNGDNVSRKMLQYYQIDSYKVVD